MNLTKVTITGADSSTDIRELRDISSLYPFVEWGILVSKGSEGGYRFPRRRWISEFTAMVGGRRADKPINVSMHLCGKWVRQMLTGQLDWAELPDIVAAAQRVQINTHGEPHVSTVTMMAALMYGSTLNASSRPREYIFQWDGVNNHLAHAAKAYEVGYRVSALFDTSAGAGVLPDSWARPAAEFPFGYAGGLSPDNVVEQIAAIEQVCARPYWIDMERRVRTEDDSALDMAKVRRVLELCQPFIQPSAEGGF